MNLNFRGFDSKYFCQICQKLHFRFFDLMVCFSYFCQKPYHYSSCQIIKPRFLFQGFASKK